MFNSLPKILITGGSGLIGQHLIPKLSSDYNIVLVTRNVASAELRIGNKVTFCSNIDDLENLNDFYGIINLAGEPIIDKRWNKKQKQQIEQSRWQITEKLVALCQQSQRPPQVFLSGSAIGYYGRQGDTPIDENHQQPYDEFSHHLCKTWENIALQAQNEYTRVCLLRTGVVLTRHGGALQKMLFPFRLCLGGRIGSGKQYLSWIHIKDLVEAILLLLDKPYCQGAFNLTAPQPVTNSDFSRTLAKQVRRPALLPMPGFMLRLLMGEGADLLLHGQRVLPTNLQQAGFEFSHPTLTEALQNLLP